MEDKHLGVYIHIPFCASKCGYCDFYSLERCDKSIGKYQDALLKHIREASSTLASVSAQSPLVWLGRP